MSREGLKSWAVAATTVAATVALGVSLTRSPSMSGEDPFVFGAAGGLIGLVAVLVFMASRERISQSLPSPRKLRGLKVFFVGFLVALSGWLIAAFASLDTGIKVVVNGFIVGAVGMAIHFYLWASSDA